MGARTPRAHIFPQLFVPAANPILVSKPADLSSSLLNTKTHSCHARVAGGAPRLSQSPGRRLTFPSPCIVERAPGPRAAGGPRHPRDSPSAPIQPCSALEGLLRITKADRHYLRPHVHVPRRPLSSPSRQVTGNSALREQVGGCGKTSGSTWGTRCWRTRGLQGCGPPPLPPPQVHVKVRQQVLGAEDAPTAPRASLRGPSDPGQIPPTQGIAVPLNFAGGGTVDSR